MNRIREVISQRSALRRVKGRLANAEFSGEQAQTLQELLYIIEASKRQLRRARLLRLKNALPLLLALLAAGVLAAFLIRCITCPDYFDGYCAFLRSCYEYGWF